MKKFLSFILIACTLLALASCANEQTHTDVTTEIIQTTEATTENSKSQEYYGDGTLKTLTIFDGNGNIGSVTEYDESGYRTRKTEYIGGNISALSKYNKNGYCISKTEYNENGDEIHTTTYENYNDLGVAMTETIYDAVNLTTTVNEYYSGGIIKKETVYDTEHNILSFQEYNSSGTPNSKTLYIYDQNNAIIKEERYYQGLLSYYYTFEYYDSGAEKNVYYYPSDSDFALKICWVFYETGESWKDIYYSNDVISSIVEYDKNGNLTKRVQYRENGTPGVIETIEYADNSYITTHTYYDINGDIANIRILEQYNNHKK